MTEPPLSTAPKLRRLNYAAHVFGHIIGLLYILVTLLFGPVKSVATWLSRQKLIQQYRQLMASLPPSMGLTAAILSLGLLELSKLMVLLAYRSGGLFAALGTMLLAKISLGYFAHLTWYAVRPKVIEVYPRIRAIDAWVGIQLNLVRGFRDRLLDRIKSAFWYAPLANSAAAIRQLTGRGFMTVKQWFVNRTSKTL